MNPDSKPDTESSLWYYAHEDNTLGPVSFDELERLLHSGEIQADTLITQQGFEEWKPLSVHLPALPSLGPLEGAGPPEAPPVGPETPGTPKGGTNAEAALGCGCFLIIAVLLGFFVKSCFFSGPSGPTAEDRKNPSVLVQKLMKEKFGDRLRYTSVTKIPGPGVGAGKLNVYVKFNTAENLTVGMWKRGIEMEMADAYRILYTSKLSLWEVTIWGYGKLNDRYGNEADDIVYKTTLHSREGVKVNWKNFDSVDLRQIWDVNFMLPQLQSE